MVVGYAGDGELGRRGVLLTLALLIVGTVVWGVSEVREVFAGAADLSARARPPQTGATMFGRAPAEEDPPGGHELDTERTQLEPEPVPEEVQEEIVVPTTSPTNLHRLALDLKDDGIPRNALHAIRHLQSAGEAAVPFLEPALLSPDDQERFLAAFVLRRIGGPPSDALLEVSVESLRRGIPRDITRTLISDTRTGATIFLAEHARRARPWLVAGLNSSDAQQRFLCAFLLARGGARDFVADVSDELLPHLRDNGIAADAVYSAHALHGLGTEVLPYLRAARSVADEQMSQLLALIERDILDPPSSKEEIARRGKHQGITNLYVDPVLQLRLGHPPVPRIRAR